MAFFLGLWWLSFAHGVDFVDGWIEDGRYFLGETEDRIQVPRWLYSYHQASTPWFVLFILGSVLATVALHQHGDPTADPYLEGLIGGTIAAGLLARVFGTVKTGVPLRTHCIVLVTCIAIGIALARLRRKSAGEQ